MANHTSQSAIASLAKHLGYDILVQVCIAAVESHDDTSLHDLHEEYERRRHFGNEPKDEGIVEFLGPALGSTMHDLSIEGQNQLITIAEKMSDIIHLEKVPLSDPISPECARALRSLCNLLYNYCYSKWDSNELFSESLSNLITVSLCFYFTNKIIQVGSHVHEAPAKSGKLNEEVFNHIKLQISPTHVISIERENFMALRIADFQGFQLPVFTLPTDENTAYVESAWSSRLATTFLIPIFSFYQMKLRQEKMESIAHFNTNASKRPDFSVVTKGGSVIVSSSVNPNSSKDVADDEILLSLEIKLGKTKIKLGKTKNKLDDTILLQLVANKAVTKTRICLLITPDTTFKVEYEGIKDHNRERKVHLSTAKFLDKSVARYIFQQLREREDYRMKHDDHIKLMDFIIKPHEPVASSSSHPPNSSNTESSKDEANTKKHHHEGSDASAKGKPSGDVDPGTAPPSRKQSKRGGETKGKGKKLEDFFAAFGEKLKITTKSTEEKENVSQTNEREENVYQTNEGEENVYQTNEEEENVYQTNEGEENVYQTNEGEENFSQTNEGKNIETKEKDVKSGLRRRILGSLQEKNTFTRVSKLFHWNHKREFHSMPLPGTNSKSHRD
ncbi:hypothetical protein I9W82_003360 [Candida metapsilosis]|uniref:Uncharacterized protein n=1 Tax=Candida metapsilosis TaxID=273372 RepID=A0A8H7ZCX4_9ASCO|nr:hypothetical protein I9W82_003360 [Candida metapsilosis]